MLLYRRNAQGELIPWIGYYDHPVIDSQAKLTRADGTEHIIEDPMGPCTYMVRNHGAQVLGFYVAGIWPVEEVTRVGGILIDPFVVPDGKQLVSELRIVELPDGSIIQTGDLEDLPAEVKKEAAVNPDL